MSDEQDRLHASALSTTTLERIQSLLAEKFSLEPHQLQPDSNLEGLGIDSLGVIEFMFDLETEFKIQMPEERAEIRTVRDIVTAVEHLMSQQAGSKAL